MSIRRLVDESLHRLERGLDTKISSQDYDRWLRNDAIIDGLKGISIGESFCLNFDVIDYLLVYHAKDDYDRATTYIRNQYVR